MLGVINEVILLKVNKALNETISQYVAADDSPEGFTSKLERLNDKKISVALLALITKFTISIEFKNNKVELSLVNAIEKSDLHIELSIGSVLRSGIVGVEQAIRDRDVKFTGDLGLAMDIQSLMSHSDFQFRELFQQKLENVTSPHFAWSCLNIIDKVLFRLASKQEQFIEQVSDYLQTESNLIVSKYEINDFISDVDKLKDDLARLQARVNSIC